MATSCLLVTVAGMTHRPSFLVSARRLCALLLGLCLVAVIRPSCADPVIGAARRFAIDEFEIEGNTVLPTTAVERAVTPFLGPDKTLADLEGARAALEKVYQDQGYLSVYVEGDDQIPLDGISRLRVTEGKVARLKVSGSRYHDPAYIRETAAELSPGQVPNFNTLQTQLAELNRNEVRRVQPVIKPGYEAGTVEAELQVSDQLPLQFSVELNNRQVQFTQPMRLQATARYENLWQSDHALSVTAITTPQDIDESKVLALSYTVPLRGGDAWLGFLVLSDSLVEPLGAANVVGKGVTLGVRRLWALPGHSGFQHNLSFGADFKDLKERIVADDSALSSPLRYVPMKLDYSASWQTDDTATSLAVGGVFSLRGVVRRSLDCADTGVVDQFACKREGGDGSFAVLTLDATHSRPLWRGRWDRWQVRGRLGAQFSAQPLVGAEQFSIGGIDSVRGYYESEAVGDLGVHAGLEVRSPNWVSGLAGDGSSALAEVQALAFVEAGRVQTHEAGNAQEHTTLAGTGLGLKVRARRNVSAQMDVAWPLRSTDATRRHDPRAHVRVGVEF